MTPQKFIPGQRWVSDSEPELGLGVVLEAGFRDVKIRFAAAEETRVYMQRGAPLRRARLAPGDRARARSGAVVIVDRVEERDGLLVYHGGGQALLEGDLIDRMAFSDPDKRLLAGQAGKPRAFALRLRTLELRRAMLGSRVRGLAGARMELLPHQIAIAHEVASRHRPRVLLADEVGLGKTIEAGMVFHRLHVTGQIDRVLVIAPSQLVHQWMAELYRRFHHLFTVLDEEFCRAEEKGDASKNPFALRQLILCPVDFLAHPATGARRVQQAVEAGIDLLIVDEAHHLQWSPEKAPPASPEYAAVEGLARAAGGVLLLTATPIQLGQAGHFGRLRLLDPGRFASLDAYLAETGRYEELARAADALLSSDIPDRGAAEDLRGLFPDDAALAARVADYLSGTGEGFARARDRLVEDLIDRHGTGRLMFRNRRQAMGGFPGRVVHPVALDASGDGTIQRDPRIAWLVRFLSENPDDKILLITSRKSDVFALQEVLPTLTTVPFAAFHENLTMTTRDKNAAWFARPGGARLLICSEIGSEGRNFQFAKHLILFDLPEDPGVLEQRIGRLDRIGRKGEVHIHVPYLRGTAHEVLFRWYHEGFDAFRNTVLGADAFHELLGGDLRATIESLSPPDPRGGDSRASGHGDMDSVEALIRKTRDTAAHVRETLEKGRDRLLEIHSNRAGAAAELIAEIHATDADADLEGYLVEVFDHFGMDVQETAVRRGLLVVPGERMLLDAFPGIPEEGLALTFDRGEALAREDMAFVSIDHPIARTAVDLVLEDEDGRSAFVTWPNPPAAAEVRLGGLALEAVFVLSATAPGALHVDRFLPPTPVRALVDQDGESLGGLLASLDAAGPDLEQASTGLLEEHHALFAKLIPGLVDAARGQAALKESVLKRAAHKEAESRLLSEAERLRALRAVNPSVSEAEIAAAEAHARAVMEHIARAELRLDAVRLVLMGETDL